MAKNQRSLKKLYNLHAWVGFQLALLMFIVLASGTIASLSNEIDWLIFPELRASAKPENANSALEIENWVGIYRSINKAYPTSEVTSMTKLDSDYLTFRVVLKDEALKNRFIQVDPWTYEVKGDIPRLTVQRFFRDFHRYLFMPAFPGLLIVGPLSMVLLISIYTGIKTTRNWRKALWRMRLRHGQRIFLSDLHKLLGLWGLWFSTLIAITGAWYFYEFGSAIADSRVEPSAPVLAHARANNHVISVNEFNAIIKRAYDAHEDWEITALYMPYSETTPIQLRGVSHHNPIIRNRALRVFIDPQSHDIVETWTPDTLSTQAYINEYADPLHFGNFGGFWLKLVWFVFGTALTTMSFTGVLMTWKRTRTQALTRAQKITLPIFACSLIAFIFWFSKFS